MSTSTSTVRASTNVSTTPQFWERLLGGTTWLSGGFWAPDGIYSRFVSPLICVLWVLVVSRVLLTRSPTTHPAW